MTTTTAAEPRPRRTARLVATGAAWTTIVAAAAVLAGWAFSIQRLQSVVPGIVNMNPLTATGFILAGFALVLQDAERARRLAQALAAAVLLLGALRIFSYVTLVDIGQDAWLFHGRSSWYRTAMPSPPIPHSISS